MNPFRLEKTSSTLRLQLQGEATIETVGELHRCLNEALAELPRELIVDAAAVTRVDAAVLQLLHAAARSATRAQVERPSEAWLSAIERLAFDPFQ